MLLVPISFFFGSGWIPALLQVVLSPHDVTSVHECAFFWIGVHVSSESVDGQYAMLHVGSCKVQFPLTLTL
jgi:hypothetical protein